MNYTIDSARRRRRIRQTTCGITSITGSCACLLFFLTFAVAYDAHAPWQIQVSLATVSGVGLIVAIMSLIIGFAYD
jgi:hypothetical protein